MQIRSPRRHSALLLTAWAVTCALWLPLPAADPLARAQEPAPTLPPIPTPTARPVDMPWRVGLQVGHWRNEELPDELANLRGSTGAHWGGVSEAELNGQIVAQVRPLLEAQGVLVDVIPATVPPAYDGDAFVAVHADGTSSGAARGWKLATPWRASPASKQLAAAVRASYGAASGLPEDVGGVTINMRGYYAFNYRRYTHAITRTTSAIIVETGFMTNAADREVLFHQQERVARGIAEGILTYLAQRDRSDGTALLPPEFPPLRPRPGALLRTAPSEASTVLAALGPDDRVFPFALEGGWYELFVRSHDRAIGFVREGELEPRPPDIEPTPTALLISHDVLTR